MLQTGHTEIDLHFNSLFLYFETADLTKGSHILCVYNADYNCANNKTVSLLPPNSSVWGQVILKKFQTLQE